MNVKTISLALTWDGARWPNRLLSPKARIFLGRSVAPSATEMAKLFRDDQVSEIRVCWVPRLGGGGDVLSVPFANQMRVGFNAAKTIPLGDMLGVIYKR